MNSLEIEKIISYVQLSPTGDNAQEFRYLYDNSTQLLSIVCDFSQSESFFNPDNKASLLALGMQLASLKIASSSFGYEVIVKELNEEKVSLKIKFENSKSNSFFTLDDLEKRYTDRNPYRQLSSYEVQHFQSSLKSFFSDTDFKILHTLSKREIQTCLEIDRWMWHNENAINSLFKWVHLFKKNYEKNNSGLYWKELGVGYKEWPTLFLFKHFPNLSIKLYKYFLYYFIEEALKKNLKTSSLIFLYKKKEETLVQFGERVMYLWISINKLNISCQPMSLYTFIYRLTPELLTHDLKKDIAEFINDNNFQNDSEVFWIFRIGKSKRPLHQSRLRLPRIDVLSYK